MTRNAVQARQLLPKRKKSPLERESLVSWACGSKTVYTTEFYRVQVKISETDS